MEIEIYPFPTWQETKQCAFQRECVVDDSCDLGGDSLGFRHSKTRPKRRWMTPELVGIAVLVDCPSVIHAKSKRPATQGVPVRIGRYGLGAGRCAFLNAPRIDHTHAHVDISGRIDYWGKDEESNHRRYCGSRHCHGSTFHAGDCIAVRYTPALYNGLAILVGLDFASLNSKCGVNHQRLSE
jgi:hypothetical protein